MFLILFLLNIAEIPAELWDKLLWNKFYSGYNHSSYSNLKSRFYSPGIKTENFHVFDSYFTQIHTVIIAIRHDQEKHALISRSNFYDNSITGEYISCIALQQKVYPTIIYCSFNQNRNNNKFWKGLLVRFDEGRSRHTTNLLGCTAINNGEYNTATSSVLFYFYIASYPKVAGLNISDNCCETAPSFHLEHVVSDISYSTICNNTASKRSIIYLVGNQYEFNYCNIMKNKCILYDDSVLIRFDDRNDASCIISNSYISWVGLSGIAYPNVYNEVKIVNNIAQPSYTYLSFFPEIPARTPINTPKSTPEKSPNTNMFNKIEPSNKLPINYISRRFKQMIA